METLLRLYGVSCEREVMHWIAKGDEAEATRKKGQANPGSDRDRWFVPEEIQFRMNSVPAEENYSEEDLIGR